MDNEKSFSPYELNIEKKLLGALILGLEGDYEQISRLQLAKEYFHEIHQPVFAAIQDLANEPAPINKETVIERMRRNGTLKLEEYIAELVEFADKDGIVSGLEYYANIIKEKHRRREWIDFLRKQLGKAKDENNNIYSLIQRADTELFKMSKKSYKKDFSSFSDIAKRVVCGETKEEITKEEIRKYLDTPDKGLLSGFTDLDKITGGWHNSDLIIIAARPSMGKTAMCLSMIKNMADMNIPVAFCSIEMSEKKIFERSLVNITNNNSSAFRERDLEEWEKNNIVATIDLIIRNDKKYPIYVDDTSELSIFNLRNKALRIVKEHNVKCLFVDYMQLITARGENDKSMNRVYEISVISRELKAIAKDLDIPVISISQLSRKSEERLNKIPELSDLRDSGAIEQDADVVCFISEQIIKEKEKHQIIIAKHRNGETGAIDIVFNKDKVRFENKYKKKPESDSSKTPSE
jgi:replicative DNA helicase